MVLQFCAGAELASASRDLTALLGEIGAPERNTSSREELSALLGERMALPSQAMALAENVAPDYREV